jgi:hydrogenase maturation protease
MTDDGFGSRMAEMMQSCFHFSPEVAVLDGGTLGLDLLPRLEGIDRLLIIDALEMDAEPGAVFRLEGEEVPRAFASKLSVHQMGVQDLLAVAELQGHLPSELVVWGVQPGTVEMGLDLTPAVTAATDKVLAGVLEELRTWGVDLRQSA